ncbi:MAG: DUF2330 domain-containing protein [Myxococcota bacterium]|nr:DUF2330 domain-containing protein [Myxococcota bacterium]
MMTSIGLWAALSPSAAAFCGAYVGGLDDGELSNHTSQVVLARDGLRTTLTLANDLEGDATDFALLIPVPELDPEDVRVLDPSVLQELDGYTGPRLVAYTCEDFHYPPADRELFSWGCRVDYEMTQSSDGWGPSEASTVQIEAEFTAGEYELVILNAEQASDLLGWLDDNDYGAPAETQELLQEYIDQGTSFLAARVSLDAQAQGVEWLSPLQLSYSSESLTLPILLGTANSPGEQELILTGILPREQGELAISNYPQRTLPYNECMLPEGADYSSFYAETLDESFNQDDGEAGWLVEYSWSGGKCDPCPPQGELSETLVQELGFSAGTSEAHVTRLRMRYSPEQVHADLALYGSGFGNFTQSRFIEHNPNLGDRFEVCGQGLIESLGDCEEEFEVLDAQAEESEGCSARPGRGSVAWLGVLVGLLLMRRRSLPRG